jgi:hypothetical protein
MCKGLEPLGSGIAFAVHDNLGRIIGAVRAIDFEVGNDLAVLDQMTRWRKTNASNFFTQFVPTIERTRRWINDVILPDPTRILFLVESEDGRRLGQFALCSITGGAAQLDNGIRGEAGGNPQLFYFVELAVIQFCFEHLKVERIFGCMFSNNVMAILLHKAVGLSIEKVERLRKSEYQDEVRFDPVTDPNQVNTEVQLFTLATDRKSFYLRHPGLARCPLVRTIERTEWRLR